MVRGSRWTSMAVIVCGRQLHFLNGTCQGILQDYDVVSSVSRPENAAFAQFCLFQSDMKSLQQNISSSRLPRQEMWQSRVSASLTTGHNISFAETLSASSSRGGHACYKSAFGMVKVWRNTLCCSMSY